MMDIDISVTMISSLHSSATRSQSNVSICESEQIFDGSPVKVKCCAFLFTLFRPDAK